MSVVLLDGNRVHYETFGRGAPIVLVHGWLGSWRYWVPVMEDLAAEHRTYALDLWGFGDSDKRHKRYDVPTYVDMLAAFLHKMGISSVLLVGHTLGAAISAELAAKRPDLVSKVLAVGLPLSSDAINRKLLSAGPNDALARLFWHRQRPYAEVERSLSKIAENTIALTIQAVARLDLRETLEEIDIPVLTVYGDKDNVISRDQADELEQNHYAARVIILPDAYHFPMLDDAAKFSRLLRDFAEVDGPDGLQDLTIREEWRRRTR